MGGRTLDSAEEFKFIEEKSADHFSPTEKVYLYVSVKKMPLWRLYKFINGSEIN